jgi:Arc/MetJ family transcription regulator
MYTMVKRTTIEIDQDLLERAKRALGEGTTRATVEAALRLAADAAEDERSRRTARQRQYLERLSLRVDVAVLASEEMWR